MDRVLVWLANNQFSTDWQETFKALNIYGSVFLELGSGHGGRGNFWNDASTSLSSISERVLQ